MGQKSLSQTKFIRTDTLKKAYPVEEKNEKRRKKSKQDKEESKTRSKGDKEKKGYLQNRRRGALFPENSVLHFSCQKQEGRRYFRDSLARQPDWIGLPEGYAANRHHVAYLVRSSGDY